MNYTDLGELLQLRPYFTVKHHVTGRIRVVFSARLLEKIPHADTGQLREFLSDIRGVREVRLNLPARSVVVSYDPLQIASKVLVDLIEGDEKAAAQALKALTTHSASSKTKIQRRKES